MKASDVVVLCKLFVIQSESKMGWTYASVASGVCQSVGETHASVGRLKHARLYDEYTKTIVPSAMKEFLIHGVRYAFPVEIGTRERGVATAHSSPFFAKEIVQMEDAVYVWPYAKGNDRGTTVQPLSKGTPEAALKDHRLYELLALIDGIRIGKTREVAIAAREIERIIAEGTKNAKLL